MDILLSSKFNLENRIVDYLGASFQAYVWSLVVWSDK